MVCLRNVSVDTLHKGDKIKQSHYRPEQALRVTEY